MKSDLGELFTSLASEIIALVQCFHHSFAVDDALDGTFENDVPGFAFIALAEH